MKINFYTTSTLSDIGIISSKLIKKFFPESNHFIINGLSGWFKIWYKWIDIANKNDDAEWHIHLDEDCFITNREAIINLIEYMEENNVDIAGMPDGYNKYRSANHMALNSFFMVMNNKSIKTWANRNENYLPQFKEEWIEPYLFEKENDTNYIYKDMIFGSDDRYTSQWIPNSEPYYDFMWVLKDSGCEFHYIEPTFYPKYQSTNLLNNAIIHMWYQRDRNVDKNVSSIHTMSNKKRFDLVIEDMEKIINR